MNLTVALSNSKWIERCAINPPAATPVVGLLMRVNSMSTG